MLIISDHSYCLPQAPALIAKNDALSNEILSTSEKLCQENKSSSYLRKRKCDLESKVTKLEKTLQEERSEFDDASYFNILSKADAIPQSVLKSYANKLRKVENNNISGERAYCDEVKQFSITLFSYSKKSYEYVRETMGNCLPSTSTIRRWLEKVDGSPGFNKHAFAQLKKIVEEKEMLGQKVILENVFKGISHRIFFLRD